MNPESLRKHGAGVLIAGAVLNAAHSLSLILWIGYHPLAIAIIAVAVSILMIVGIYASYSRIGGSGLLAVTGFVTIALSYLFLASLQVIETYILYPTFNEPLASRILVASDLITNGPMIEFLRSASGKTSILGTTLFCITLLRSKAYPPMVAALIFFGTIGGYFWTVFPIPLALGSIMAYTAGFLIIAFDLKKSNRNFRESWK